MCGQTLLFIVIAISELRYMNGTKKQLHFQRNKLCAWQHNMPPPLSSPVGAPAPCAPRSRCNVAVLSHAEYVLTVTAAAALRVKAALSKAAW